MSNLTINQQPCDLKDVTVELVTDFESASRCAQWLSTRDRIAVDTETTGLSIEIDHARLVQIGDEETSFVIPLEGRRDSAAIHRAESRGWGGFAADIFSRFTGQIDMHNAPYDYWMIRNTLGVSLPRHRITDVRLLAHVHDSRRSIALKSLAKRHVDSRSDLGQHRLHDAMGKGPDGWTWETIPVEFAPYWFYAGLDTILTARVCAVIEPQVMATAPRAYALESAVAWPCTDMERRGVAIDATYTSTFLDELNTELTEVEFWADTNYGLSLGSSDKIIAVLQRDGVNLVKRTPMGAKFALDKEVLSNLVHPLAEAVLRRRHLKKMIGYLSSYLELHEQSPDGRIHASINTVGGSGKSPYENGGSQGVRTGRMSMSNPNLQNVPTRTAEGSRVRRCFVPSPGHTWVKCDADQIESRILAHLCGDQGMRDAFIDASVTGGDFFVNIAKRLFDDPDFQKSDPRRSLVKNGTYAKIYGAGLEKFAKTTGTPLNTAAEFMADFDTMYPGVPTWIRDTISTAQSRERTEGEAYVRSPLTGRRNVADPRAAYTVVNYLIQGMAGEILKSRIVDADSAGLGQYMLFPVHDEIDFEVPNEDLPEFLNTLSSVMNDDALLTVPITWSSDTGPSWGECS